MHVRAACDRPGVVAWFQNNSSWFQTVLRRRHDAEERSLGFCVVPSQSQFFSSWCMLAEAATRAGDDTEHEWRATERRSLLRSHAASEPPLWASLDAEHVPIWRLDAKTTRAREWGALARYGAYRCQIAAGNEGQVGASRAGRTRPRTQPAVDILPSEISERPHSCFPLLLFLRRCTCDSA